MKTKFLSLCLSLLLLAAASWRAEAQTTAPTGTKQAIVTINGQVLTNLLTGIDFKFDNADGVQTRSYATTPMAILQYQDSTVETVPLALVRIIFANPQGISRTPVFKGFAVSDDQLQVEGLQEKETIQLYDLNGRRLMQTRAAKGTTRIDLSPLPAGSYVFKSESAAFKFMKH